MFLQDTISKERFVQGWNLNQLEQSLDSPGIMAQRKGEAEVKAQMRDMESGVLESLIPDQS